MDRNEQNSNPVALLSNDAWQIVEDSRRSGTALCGRPIGKRRAHARLSRVGRENVCPACLATLDRQVSKG